MNCYYFGNVVPQGILFDEVTPGFEFKLTLAERTVVRGRAYANAHDVARMHPDFFGRRDRTAGPVVGAARRR